MTDSPLNVVLQNVRDSKAATAVQVANEQSSVLAEPIASRLPSSRRLSSLKRRQQSLQSWRQKYPASTRPRRRRRPQHRLCTSSSSSSIITPRSNPDRTAETMNLPPLWLHRLQRCSCCNRTLHRRFKITIKVSPLPPKNYFSPTARILLQQGPLLQRLLHKAASMMSMKHLQRPIRRSYHPDYLPGKIKAYIFILHVQKRAPLYSVVLSKHALCSNL